MENEMIQEEPIAEAENVSMAKCPPVPFMLGPSRGYLANCEKEPKNLKQAHSAALRYIKRR